MGNAASGDLAFNEGDLDTWSIAHVKKVLDKYIVENYDFGITRPDFKHMMTAVGGNDEKRENMCQIMWNVLDPNQAGMIATLESICYLCIGCNAPLDKKIEFVFNCFDFNNGGDISYDEMVILMSCSLTAMVKYHDQAKGSAKTKLPTDQEMETITDEAFLDADANANGTIHKGEFQNWVTKTLSEDNLEVTVEDILSKFGLATPSSNIDFVAEEEDGGDQSSNFPAADDSWMVVDVAGIGKVAISYEDKKFTFTVSDGLTCTSTDEGFEKMVYIRKLAELKARRLKLLTTKMSRNKKRAAVKELVITKIWEDKDDLGEYLQLVVLNLSNQERALRARKEQLEERIADFE